MTPFRLKTGSRGHPFAPTEFPKTWSTAGPARPVEALTGLRYTHLKRRTPQPGHVDRGQRLPGRAYPRKSGEITSQRPTIHRPQHPQKVSLLEFRCPSPRRRRPGIRTPSFRLRQKIFAAAGTCSRRSAPGERSRRYERERCHKDRIAGPDSAGEAQRLRSRPPRGKGRPSLIRWGSTAKETPPGERALPL
jgi:hypothetical protein